MKQYAFVNKVAVSIVQKRGVWKNIVLLCGIVSALVTVVVIWMDGISEVDWITGVFLPVFLLWQGIKKTCRQEYVNVDALVTLTPDSLTVNYPRICRSQREGPVSEVYEYRKGDIDQFQYSQELSALRIVGAAFVTVNNGEPFQCTHREVVFYMTPEMLRGFREDMAGLYGLYPEPVTSAQREK